jgi:class 3 adenylate cyclase
VYNDQGKYPETLNNYFASLDIRKEIEDKKGISASYNNIGLIYEDLGNFTEALKYHFASLKIKEEIGYTAGIAASYTNIGIIYKKQGNYTEALKNFKASLAIEEVQSWIADDYLNIGNIYERQGDFREALANYAIDLKISQQINYAFGIGTSHLGKGAAYLSLDQYPEAMENYRTALAVFQEMGNKEKIANAMMGLGETSLELKKYSEAWQFLSDARSIAKELGNKALLENNYELMTKLNIALGNWKDAYLHQQLHQLYRDSTLNEESTKKTVQIQMQYEFDKKEAATKAAQDKKDALTHEEAVQQRNIRNSTFAGLAGAFIFSVVLYRQRNKISKERKRSDELLLNILPTEVANELKEKGSADAKQFNEVTVMFTDFKGFTRISEKLTPVELVAEIDACFKAFDYIISRHRIEKIKTIGDAYMCAGGLPVVNQTHADDVVKAALEIQHYMRQHIEQRKTEGKDPFEIRIGIHTGPVVAGIVGVKKFAYDIWGDTVNIASRMETTCEEGKVNISGATHALVKDRFRYTYRGKIEAKNKGEIEMYFVEEAIE